MTDEPEKLNAFRRRQLKSMARSYTEAGIKRLGGYVVGPDVPDALAIEAIKILLDRGYGRPKGDIKHTGTNPDGSINFILRHIVEAMPPKTE
jgi:hypothetical protein